MSKNIFKNFFSNPKIKESENNDLQKSKIHNLLSCVKQITDKIIGDNDYSFSKELDNEERKNNLKKLINKEIKNRENKNNTSNNTSNNSSDNDSIIAGYVLMNYGNDDKSENYQKNSSHSEENSSYSSDSSSSDSSSND